MGTREASVIRERKKQAETETEPVSFCLRQLLDSGQLLLMTDALPQNPDLQAATELLVRWEPIWRATRSDSPPTVNRPAVLWAIQLL